MRVVIDGLPIRGDNSLSIVSEHLLSGWEQLDRDDEVHLVIRAGAPINIPDSVTVHEVPFGRLPFLSRLRAQSFALRRLCRSLRADVLLGILPTTAMTRLPCPRAVIAWDLRYRLRPEQFSKKTLVLRRTSYAIGLRQADGVACISGRTKRDLLAFYPRLAKVPVRVAHLGADHVDDWPVASGEPPYAIAFGHFANKNVDLVLEAWAALQQDPAGSPLPLRVVGLAEGDRDALQARLAQLGLAGIVSISPWLPKEDFRKQFASSSLVVFPSDFEGFGLPAVEAMRLGIPVVITPEPALLEVTGGLATVVDGEGPEALARAVAAARLATPESIAAARRHAAVFTWANFATGVRGVLGEAMAPARAPAPGRAVRSGRIRTLPARLAAGFVAGLLVIGGATAVAVALGSSHPGAASGGGSSATTTTGATTPAVARQGVGQPGASGAAGSQGAAGGKASATTAPSGGGVATHGSQGSSASTLPSKSLPAVGVPPVTVPPVAVVPVTVPTTVCSTTTTIASPVTMPCSVTVSGQSCSCP